MGGWSSEMTREIPAGKGAKPYRLRIPYQDPGTLSLARSHLRDAQTTADFSQTWSRFAISMDVSASADGMSSAARSSDPFIRSGA